MFPVIAAAAGAAAMYFFDPDQGKRRRALVRDKFAWLRDEMGDVREAAGGKAEDLRNRTKGMIHEAKKTVSNRADMQDRMDTQARNDGHVGMADQARDESHGPASEDYGTNTIQKAA